MNYNNKIILLVTFILAMPISIAEADFALNTFSCTPSEVVINDVFSCTAQIINNGDAKGTVNTATLYPDSNDWLENSNYPQASENSVDPGQTTEVTFTSLRATKSGNNGFSKITLDDVTDTLVADNNVKVNIIDVIVTVSNSLSSATMSDTFDSTAEVTAGGNIDVTLTFTVNSGGCSIGNQDSEKTISDMQDGNKQSRSWTVTQGTSGDCSFKISAAATGESGIASKIDSSSSSVTCTDCPTSSSSSGSSGGSGGAGGGGGGGAALLKGALVFILGELNSAKAVELAVGEKVEFNISGEAHGLAVNELTETQATLTIASDVQTHILSVGDEKLIDLDHDTNAELSVKLKSINIITNKATIILRPSSEKLPLEEDTEDQENEVNLSPEITNEKKSIFKIIFFIIVGFLLIIGIVILFHGLKSSYKKWKRPLK